MDKESSSSKDSFLPLPERQFTAFIFFWSIVTLAGLALALFFTLRDLSGWTDWVVAAAIVAQAGLYLGLILFFRGTAHPSWAAPAYFIGAIALWILEVTLRPEIFWLGFMYLGQMYGMLPLVQAVLGTIVILATMFFSNTFLNWANFSTAELFGFFAGWASILFLLVYINHLMRTSRERAVLIARLQKTQLELEAARQKEAELAVFQERERLARDMHDTLGHNLVAISVQLEAIQRLYKVDPVQANTMLENLKQLTRGSMEELRRTLEGLRTPGLDGQPLSAALRALCVEFSQRAGVEVTCQIDDRAAVLPASLAETLWRVAQEAFTNVQKHAQARHVHLEMKQQSGYVVLVVADDGCGADPNQPVSSGHYGLQGMRERVEGLGGELVLESQPDAGFRLEAAIPTLEKGQ
jgi:signal transduction histidine kinase